MIAAGVFQFSGGYVTATLLAVDDSKTMRKVIEITFAGENYRMVLADSPADAMAKLRADKPSVALVDALLGGTSGYDLCQQIKAEMPQVGVIVLSSKQHPYDRVKGGAVGADDFLDKPFDSQALIDKVAALAQKIASAPAARPAERTADRPAAERPAAERSGERAAPMARPAAVVGQPGAAAATAAAAPRPHSTTMTFGAPAAARSAAAASPPAASPAAPAAATPFRPAPVAAPVAAAQPQAAAAAAPAKAAPAPIAAAPAATALIDASMETKLTALGLTKDQIAGVLSLSREVVEQVVWEVVPVLAETLIREEIKRLSAD
jgi:CheY-like chemotaxis protein